MLALASFVLWPRTGLLSRWKLTRGRTERVLREDILKHLHHCEMESRMPSVESIAGVIQSGPDDVVWLLKQMEDRQLVTLEKGDFHLTETGRSYALNIIRAHRLWERYLADHTGLEETEWHRQAEQQEHSLSPSETEALSARLRHPVYDPHGDPIPTSSGDIVYRRDIPLTEAPLKTPVRISHIEDEPEVVYAQLIAEGLRAGMVGQVSAIESERVSFWSEGEEHRLAPIVARNVSVVVVGEKEASMMETTSERLSDLVAGEEATVVGISRVCRGLDRRRFMDLGILPGTRVEAEMASPSGDPMAFRIRGTVIALRREQAQSVYVENRVEVMS